MVKLSVLIDSFQLQVNCVKESNTVKELKRQSQAQNGQGHPAPRVAEQILWERQGEDTTPMHLLKLTYLCHGWSLGYFSRKLINEAVEAWRYGPVIPSIYHAYKVFRSQPVTGEVTNHESTFGPKELTLIRRVLKAYQDYDALDLSAITHTAGTPWDQIYKKGRRTVNQVIPNEVIEAYYKARLRRQHEHMVVRDG